MILMPASLSFNGRPAIQQSLCLGINFSQDTTTA